MSKDVAVQINDNTGKWGLRDMIFMDTKSHPTLHVIWFTNDILGLNLDKQRRSLDDFVSWLRSYGVNKSNTITYEVMPCLVSAEQPDQSYRNMCQRALDEMYNNFSDDLRQRKPSVIMIVFPGDQKNTRLHPETKRWGDCVKGIPTVCILEDKLKGPKRDRKGDLITNRKINAKVCANVCYVSNISNMILLTSVKSENQL